MGRHHRWGYYDDDYDYYHDVQWARRQRERRERERRRKQNAEFIGCLVQLCVACVVSLKKTKVAPAQADVDTTEQKQKQYMEKVQKKESLEEKEVKILQDIQEDMVQGLDKSMKKTDDRAQLKEMEEQRNRLLGQMKEMEEAGYKYEDYPNGVPSPTSNYA